MRESSVTKTQIQVPEELYRELKEFAKQREWSLAETFRRGAELLLETYPGDRSGKLQAWSPPVSKKVGWKGLSAEGLRELAFQDQEPRLGNGE